MRIGECQSCQLGDHSRHHKVIHAVPEGMMGGVICGCKGECEGDGSVAHKKEKAKAFLRRIGIRR